MTSTHLQLKFTQTRVKKQTCPEADSNTNEPIFQVATLRPQSAWDERGTGQRRPPRSVASVAGTKGRKRERERGRASEPASEREENQKDSSPPLSPSPPPSLLQSVFGAARSNVNTGKSGWSRARQKDPRDPSNSNSVKERRGLLSSRVSSSSRGRRRVRSALWNIRQGGETTWWSASIL